jgi:hypothetical protein
MTIIGDIRPQMGEIDKHLKDGQVGHSYISVRVPGSAA